MVVAKNKVGHIITRNSSFFKLFEYEHQSIDDSDVHELANGNSDLDILLANNSDSSVNLGQNVMLLFRLLCCMYNYVIIMLCIYKLY